RLRRGDEPRGHVPAGQAADHLQRVRGHDMGGRLPVGEERMYSRRLVTLAICLVLAACGGAPQAPTATTAASAPPAAAATATPLVPVAVKAAFTNLTGDSLPIWTAMDAGIFKKNGLDVDLQSIDGGARGMAALL